MMKWTSEAEEELKKVPAFVRRMAKRAVEEHVRKSGKNEVTVEDVRAARERHISFIEKKPKSGERPTRIAVVRCDIVAEVCPGVACFRAFHARHCHFSTYGDNTEIIGFFTCGGCPGRRAARLVERLVDHDLDVVHLSSCMMLEGDYPKCPHWKQIKKSIEAKGIRVVEGTHH